MRSIAFFDGVRGYLAVYVSNKRPTEFVTVQAHSGKLIQWENCPEMREGQETSGHVLEWALDKRHMGRKFAKDCGARLYKIREGYDGAIERMRADADPA